MSTAIYSKNMVQKSNIDGTDLQIMVKWRDWNEYWGLQKEHWRSSQFSLDNWPSILAVDRRDVGPNSFTVAYLDNDIELSYKFKIYFYEFIG